MKLSTARIASIGVIQTSAQDQNCLAIGGMMQNTLTHIPMTFAVTAREERSESVEIIGIISAFVFGFCLGYKTGKE